MKYFAYGSNMDSEQMKDRCPRNHKLLGVAELEGWEFFINSLGVASIAIDQESESEVYGLLYEISEKCLACLDMHEGYPNAYGRDKEKIVFNNKEVEAWVYFEKRSIKTGTPRPNYLERIIQAAIKFDFHKDYVKHLESFLPAGKS